MYPHVGEAFIPARCASYRAEQLYKKVAKLCQSAHLEEFRKSVVFEAGGANIHFTNDGLLLHVFARDVLTYYGIRTLMEGSLPKAVLRSVKAVEWLPPRQALVPHELVNGI
ncbi:hypothetical protein KXR64_20280 [Brucella intermedia]|uniref:hypothetical protein n=1 Tax=Brucella TaxID=234 RepID=UPI00094641F7|nr:hypothetical protein [Brucella intermedia]